MQISIARSLLSKISHVEKHRIELFQDVLIALKDMPLILKGGTALMLFYELDRFSEDLDFDAYKPYDSPEFIRHLEVLLEKMSFKFALHKDTPTVKRFKLYTKRLPTPIKLEISFRQCAQLRDTLKDVTVQTNAGLRVYTIDRMLNLKLSALLNRTAARDLYDVAFISSNWIDALSQSSLQNLRQVLDKQTLEDWMAMFEDAFLEDERLGEEAFWLTYSRLLTADKLIRRKLFNQQKSEERQKHFR